MGYLFTVLPYTNPGITMDLLEVMRRNLPTVEDANGNINNKIRSDIFQAFFSHKIDPMHNEFDVIYDAYINGHADTFLQLMLVRFRTDDNGKWVMCGQELYNVQFFCIHENVTKMIVSVAFSTLDPTISSGVQLMLTIDHTDPALVMPCDVTEGQRSYSRIMTFGDINGNTAIGLGVFASNSLDYRTLLRADLIASIPTYTTDMQLCTTPILNLIKAQGYAIHHFDVYSIDTWHHNDTDQFVVNYQSHHHMIVSTTNSHALSLYKDFSDDAECATALFCITASENGLIVIPDYMRDGALEQAVYIDMKTHGNEVDAFWDFDTENGDPTKLKGLIVPGEL